MAEIVNSMPASGRHHKYDYESMFDGQARRFTHGVDFSCGASSFSVAVLAAARRRELYVKTKTNGDSVYVQAIGKRGPASML